MDFTANQWAIIALVFILGWLLGMASRSDRKWLSRYEEERAANEVLRRDQDALRRDYEIRQRERDTRDAATNNRMVPASASAGLVRPLPADSISAMPSHHRDDLTRIDGIDAHDEVRLNDAGIHSFADVAALGTEETAALEAKLGYSDGRIENQRWREQATTLGNDRFDRSVSTGPDPTA